MKAKTFDEIIESEIETLIYSTHQQLSAKGMADAITWVKTKMVKNCLIAFDNMDGYVLKAIMEDFEKEYSD